MREVYVLMRDVGEYEDRDTSPVLATLNKAGAEAWLATARAFVWPGRLDIFDDEHDNCAPAWETADALRKVRTYGEPTYRLATVRLTDYERVAALSAAAANRIAELATSGGDDAIAVVFARKDLEAFAEALRLLLEVPDAD